LSTKQETDATKDDHKNDETMDSGKGKGSGDLHNNEDYEDDHKNDENMDSGKGKGSGDLHNNEDYEVDYPKPSRLPTRAPKRFQIKKVNQEDYKENIQCNQG
jgi:hypothetical protein